MARPELKIESLWKITVETTPEAEEAVAALLERLYGQKASVYSPEESKTSFVTIFTPKTADQKTFKREALDAGLNFVADCGLHLGPANITVDRVPRQDWSESWKKHFKTIEVGNELLIRPSWSKQKVKKGQALVVLDPGLSFGTGQHPTTAYCLEQIVRHRPANGPKAFLDVGTGSGILAIAAAKLGYAPVHAFDNDPQAVQYAKANARRNRVEKKVQLECKDLTEQSGPGEYDLICANLISNLLIAEAARIQAQMKPDGVLVLAGILAQEFSTVQKAFSELNLVLTDGRTEGEWRSGTFARSSA